MKLLPTLGIALSSVVLLAAPLRAEPAPTVEASATKKNVAKNVAKNAPRTLEKKPIDMKKSELRKTKLGSIKAVHVLADTYLAGQPSPEDLPILKKRGIKTVITLRKTKEVHWDEAAGVKEQGMKYVQVPFQGVDELTPQVFDKVLKVLRDKKRGPTLFHCGSANRVGAIWYAYRVLDCKVPPEVAFEEAKTVGLRTPGYAKKAQVYVLKKQGEKLRQAAEEKQPSGSGEKK